MRGVKWCPVCTSKESEIIDTRTSAAGYVFRRRKCPKCGVRWSTVEIPKNSTWRGGARK